MQRTKIEWATHVWNPTSGCSFGCEWCYARRIAHRFKRSFAPTCHPEKLDEPWHVRKPARIFVDSAGDLFDPVIPPGFIQEVFWSMSDYDQHAYFILTKRPDLMGYFLRTWGMPPLPNVWLGVSVTNQADADERIPLLLQTPAARRFVSAEPFLGRVDLRGWETYDHGCQGAAGEVIPRIDWVIIGAQTGPGAKPPEEEWVSDLTEQCIAAGVPVFHKNSLGPIYFTSQEMP